MSVYPTMIQLHYNFISSLIYNLLQTITQMKVIIPFALLLLLTSVVNSSACHSSCLTCSGPLEGDCLSCDISTLTFLSVGGLSYCVGIPQNTAVLQIIDSPWSGISTYLYQVGTRIALYTSGALPPPFVMSILPSGTEFTNFLFNNVPSNRYMLQIRTHGTLPIDSTCTWYNFFVDINGNTIPVNVTSGDWLSINAFNDATRAFTLGYLADTTQVCPSMEIIDITMIAFLCLPNCASCADAVTCISCDYGTGGTDYYLDVLFQCVSSCAQSYYVDNSGISWCDKCDPSCIRCTGSNTTCNICNATMGYVMFQSNNTCTTICPDGQYADFAVFTCVNCYSNCKTCALSSRTCTSCGVSSVGGQLYLYNKTCIFTCGAGSYVNSTSNSCINCHASCLVCVGPLNSQCQSCNNITAGGVTIIYYLSIGQTLCSTTCPDGQYINSSVPNMCQPCSSNCLTCTSSPTTCLSCAASLFLSNSVCLTGCASGTYGALSQCFGCDAACATCFGSGPSACYSCKANYYLQLGTTICSPSCPAGQMNSTSVCLACSTQCATCSVTISNCTSCLVVNGVTTVYLYAGNCQSTCPTGFFAVIQLTSNICSPCSTICLTCSGSSSNCSTCNNVTTTLAGVSTTKTYYKDPSLFLCNTTCPVGYIISSSNNSCLQCQTGCKSCQSNTSFCPQCQSVGSIDYYFYSNSCVIVCPDGTFRNTTDYYCHVCAYYTLNQECIQQCPSGYVGVLKGQVAICQACTNCTYKDIPFSISSKVILPSKNFMHEVAFTSGVSQNCSATSIASGLQVYVLSNKHRLLASTTSLTVLSVSFSADYATIIVITSAGEIDITSASIGMTFLPGTVYTPSGILYNSLSSTLSLQNPVFLDSYYRAYVEDKNRQIEGIVFTLFSALLLILSLFLHKEKLTVSMLFFVQTIQIVGLLRVKALPIVLEIYNVLVGFSYYELSFMPNVIIKIIPGLTLSESASDAATFVYGSQNFINNFGSVISFTVVMSSVVAIFHCVFKEDDYKLKIVKLVQNTIIQYWMVIILYGPIMSILSLERNSLTDSNTLFTSSILLSVAIVIVLVIFAVNHFQSVLHTQFHRICMFFRVVSVVVLAYRVDLAILCFNSFEIFLTIIEFSFYNMDSKPEKLLLGIERMLGLIAINSCLFVKDASTLILILAVTLSTIAAYKLYQLVRDIVEYFNKKRIGSLQADASISLNNSLPAKSQQLNLRENSRSNANINSQNFLFDDTISQKFGEIGNVDKSLHELNDLKATAFPNGQVKVQNAIQSMIIQENEDKQGDAVVRRRRRRIKEVKESKYEDPKMEEVQQIEVIKIEHNSEKASAEENEKELSLPELQSSQSDEMEIVSVQ